MPVSIIFCLNAFINLEILLIIVCRHQHIPKHLYLIHTVIPPENSLLLWGYIPILLFLLMIVILH